MLLVPECSAAFKHQDPERRSGTITIQTPFKVLHILNELRHSGAEVMLQLAFKKFKVNGFESHILSTGNEIGDYAVILQQTGYKIHHIPFRKRPGFFADVRTFLKKERFEAVHIHTERAFIWYVLLAKLLRVPTVVRTFHNVFLFSSYLRWKRTLQRKVSRKLCRAIHTAISDSVLANEKQKFNNPCVLVRNWTDVHKFRPPSDMEKREAKQLYRLGVDDFAVSIVGSCSSVKNHFAAFAAVKKANGICAENESCFCMLGRVLLFKRKSYTLNKMGWKIIAGLLAPWTMSALACTQQMRF